MNAYENHPLIPVIEDERSSLLQVKAALAAAEPFKEELVRR